MFDIIFIIVIPKKAIDINKILNVITEVAIHKNVKLALIFGSFARGDYSKRSDLDVIFVTETNDNFVDRIGKFLIALRNYDILKFFDIDILVYTPSEFAKMKEDQNRFISRALKEGKILYER